MIITYLTRVILITASMWLIYRILLSDEPTFRFNRFFLLLAGFLPLIIPFFNWGILVQSEWVILEVINAGTEISVITTEVESIVSEYAFDWSFWLQQLVFMVSMILLLNFIRQLFLTWKQIQKGEIIRHKRYTLVLMPGEFAPQSLFKYVFIGKKAYEYGDLPSCILEHELAHVQQGHTWDILLIEALIAIFWFNPFLYILRQSIRLNHEFLADQEVIMNQPSSTNYQKILLQYIGQSNRLSLASSFNFKMIKKRFLMMTRRKTTYQTIIKQVLILPAILGLCFLFSDSVQAQAGEEAPKKMLKEIESTKTQKLVGKMNDKNGIKPGPGISESEMKQYSSILAKYGVSMEGGERMTKPFEDADREKLQDLYVNMTTEQRKQQPFWVWMRPAILKSTPSMKQLNEWMAHTYYHIYIDGKRVENSVLENYKNYQFTRHEVNLKSRTTDSGKEKRYWKVDLMLPDYYNQQLAKAKENGKDYQFTFIMEVKPNK
ncbi:MAG: M56 family metallopeptidase [Bacteroidota bacterium]